MADVAFVHFLQFNNGEARRALPYAGVHAWAVQSTDLDEFLRVFPEDSRILQPAHNGTAFALDYKAADAWITRLPIHSHRALEKFELLVPPIDPFDPAQHCVQKVPFYEEAYGSYHRAQGVWDFRNPFQVLVCDADQTRFNLDVVQRHTLRLQQLRGRTTPSAIVHTDPLTAYRDEYSRWQRRARDNSWSR